MDELPGMLPGGKQMTRSLEWMSSISF